ncbi:predicted coding region HI0213.1 [Haemophilus influenzae Rd KW20]|uniref:Uncharacterized protein HI_0213.1 n=1 Tax=Haemophilus influenzae (strain ATCC 51907 / DSM 11121 / KW20 / Rd) TaxID=71421 RepID=Y213A_HAEIN|nr:RecName: Full=Uncharacterized protein HI_0213.1 [Haemophilus influenzae Rd KW20]AAC21886.1 predicted coding region HI0213.1 [Haemophilus influenzae Rd KW20]
MKIIYIILGFLSLAIGIIGIFPSSFAYHAFFITYFIFLHKRFKTLRTMVFRHKYLSKTSQVLS